MPLMILLSFDDFFGEEKFSWLPFKNKVADETLSQQYKSTRDKLKIKGDGADTNRRTILLMKFFFFENPFFWDFFF
jgi:hypothetical protein